MGTWSNLRSNLASVKAAKTQTIITEAYTNYLPVVAPYSFFVRVCTDFENLAMAQAFKLYAKVTRKITQ